METISLGALTADDFARLRNTEFRLRRGDGADTPLRLSDVRSLGHAAAAARPPFSIEFLGTPNEVLAQRIYRLEHAEMGAMEIFLVPVGKVGEETRYEAVFS